MNIFPAQELSETEASIVLDKLSDPAVKKYLHSLAYNTGTTIVMSQPGPEQTDEQYLRTLAHAQGQLSVIETLLSFEVATKNG